MNPKLKLTAYAVMVILCAWFGLGFYSNYTIVTKASADSDAGAPAPTLPATNVTATTNQAGNTNEVSGTNAPVVAGTNAPDSANGTNIAAATDTNAPAPQTNAVASAPPSASPKPAPDLSSRRVTMTGYLAGFVLAVIGLGILIAVDVTQFLGTQAVDFLFNDSGEGQRDPEYERAETEWANGRHLDAIQLMREFLKKHPREIYAALRIAEIYEKDLKNYLAAALEYEEILKNKLPAERWGWAAIHLCNLYSRLNKGDMALALLRRVADEYPKTGAAKKARARLGLAEPAAEESVEEAPAEAEEDQTGENMVITVEEHPPELEPRREVSALAPEPAAPAEPAKQSLPKGFRPKK